MRAFAVLLALLITLAGCVPLADHPAGDESAPFDARLAGPWRTTVGDDPFFVFIGPADERGFGVRIHTVEGSRDGRWKVDDYTGVSAAHGDHGLLSVRYESAHGERRGWFIVRYALDRRDRLRIQTLDEARLAAMVRAGEVAGRVGKELHPDVDLTIETDALVALLESKRGAQLFGMPHTLVRVAAGSAHQSTGAGVAPTPARVNPTLRQ